MDNRIKNIKLYNFRFLLSAIIAILIVDIVYWYQGRFNEITVQVSLYLLIICFIWSYFFLCRFTFADNGVEILYLLRLNIKNHRKIFIPYPSVRQVISGSDVYVGTYVEFILKNGKKHTIHFDTIGAKKSKRIVNYLRERGLDVKDL
jgi:hypothetical protein